MSESGPCIKNLRIGQRVGGGRAHLVLSFFLALACHDASEEASQLGRLKVLRTKSIHV